MNGILERLLEVTVYSSAIAGILLLLRVLFKKKISAKLQYMAWLLLIVRLMVPVTVESGFHFWHEPAVTAREIAEETVRRAERAEAIRQAEAAEVSVPQSASQKQNAAPKAPAKVSTENVPVQAEKKPAIHITWQHIVLAVWTMGMIAFGGFFVRARIRFLRKIVLQAPTEEMYREYERICGEMRLCRVPELVVCEIASPALMGRRILLPEGLSGQALRYALYHEMTHYRRKDHIMVVLMSALRCVYWFNPLVWAAFKAMQEDMEVACDAGVLQLIGTEEKGGYLMTLLKMFSSHTTPAIGMAQAESKRAAKARIEGAFRKHRTGRMMRMVSAVVACMILVCCFTTACQPTPEVSPLQGKGQLQEKIEESEEVKVYEETEPKLQYSEEFEGGNKYEINAEVIGQDVENIPIYDIEFVPFEDGEVLQARLEAAFPDYVLGADYLTKEFYTKKLEEYQKYLARFENGQHPITGEPLAEGEAEEWIPQIPIAKEYEYMWVVNEETNETLGDPPLADNLKALLKETMAKLEKAPSAEEIGTSFVFEDHDGAEVVSVTATSEKETLDLLFQNGGGNFNVFWLDNMTLRENGDGYSSFSSPTSNIAEFADNTKFQEVKTYADAMVKNLGAEDLVLTEIMQTADGNDFNLLYTKNMNTGVLREIIPQNFYSTVKDTDMQEYIDLWESETFELEFHEGSLYQAKWHNPSRLVKKVENANVLPWEEILEIAKQQLKYIVVPEEGKMAFGFDDYSDIVVEKIELGYTKMLVQDTYDQYQLIPTWNFMGYCSANPSKNDICFLTVNAVDGTIMEHRLGY